MDVDSLLTKWRYNHVMMVQRMIGFKPGTGVPGEDVMMELMRMMMMMMIMMMMMMMIQDDGVLATTTLCLNLMPTDRPAVFGGWTSDLSSDGPTVGHIFL